MNAITKQSFENLKEACIPPFSISSTVAVRTIDLYNIISEHKKMLTLLRSYSMKPSGACSRCANGDKTGECDICWPDIWGLVQGHSEAHYKTIEERDRLREALAKHGDHLPGCNSHMGWGKNTVCDCGLAATLQPTDKEGES